MTSLHLFNNCRLLLHCTLNKFPHQRFVRFLASPRTHRFQNFFSMGVPSKPLNVLVFTGETSEENERFRSISNVLKGCLHPDYYIVYLLTPIQVMNQPWHENLKLLIVSSDSIEPKIANAFGKYISRGGNVFVSCSDIAIPDLNMKTEKYCSGSVVQINFEEFHNINVWRGVTCYKIMCPHSVIVKDHCGGGVTFKPENTNIIVSEICLEGDYSTLKCDRSDFDLLVSADPARIDIFKAILSKEFNMECSDFSVPDLSPCFLFVSNELSKNDIISKLRKENCCKKSEPGLELLPVDYSHSDSVMTASSKCLPIVYNFQDAGVSIPFSGDIYFSFLKSSTFGHSLFFIPVVGSTMDVIVNLDHIEGSCVVAQQQILAKGRGSNKWISPLGSASFSLCFNLPLSSKLGQRMPLIQHMVATSIVLAVRERPGYEDVDLRLKWPNDIYYSNKVKIGGVLVTSTIAGNIAKIFTGTGVNVSNSCPTLCINDLIQFHNKEFRCNLDQFSVEQLIASSLTELEQLIDDCKANGPENFLQIYYKYWMHSNQIVTLDTSGEKVTVVGLNEYGYLLVKKQSGEELTLLPDGNSFDIMKNLIIAK